METFLTHIADIPYHGTAPPKNNEIQGRRKFRGRDSQRFVNVAIIRRSLQNSACGSDTSNNQVPYPSGILAHN